MLVRRPSILVVSSHSFPPVQLSKFHIYINTLRVLAAEQLKPNHYTPPPSHHSSHQISILCRYGLGCTNPNCSYQHPNRQSTQPCRYGSGCTRATCTFQHPPDRVLPNTFHRGLGTSGGFTTVSSPETGSIGQASPHKSVTFNKTLSNSNSNASSIASAGAGKPTAELQKKVKEVEEMKNKVAQAEAAAAANKKQDESNASVSISV